MTTGIYKLTFKGTDAVYIGKSKNIQKRYSQHLASLKARNSSQKLLYAYDTFGTPTLVIIEECAEDILDTTESKYIEQYNSVIMGFNTMYETHHSKTSLIGDKSQNAKHTNEVYVEIAKMLSQNYTVENICDVLATTRGVVSGIKRLETHLWLKEAIPDIYSLIESKYNMYVSQGMSLTYQNKDIPTVVSPGGAKFKVASISAFAREHGLDCGGLCRLINKKAASLKGWTLEGCEYIPPKVISPEGEVFIIPKNGITKFSKEHGLDNSILSKVLKGSVHNHRGWKKYLE